MMNYQNPFINPYGAVPQYQPVMQAASFLRRQPRPDPVQEVILDEDHQVHRRKNRGRTARR